MEEARLAVLIFANNVLYCLAVYVANLLSSGVLGFLLLARDLAAAAVSNIFPGFLEFAVLEASSYVIVAGVSAFTGVEFSWRRSRDFHGIVYVNVVSLLESFSLLLLAALVEAGVVSV